jgi:integrase
MPLRTIYRRALHRGDVMVNPTLGLELPAIEGKRDRVASPDEAAELLAALPEAEPAIVGDRLLRGPAHGRVARARLGERRPGRRRDPRRAQLGPGRGLVAPKSRKSTRTVPIPGILRGYLAAHRERRFAIGQRIGFVFGETPTAPFNYDVTYDRAVPAWKAAGLKPICLHECRHTYVTLMFEAGLTLEEIGDYVGHNSAYVTDRYRHLREGHEARAAERFDAFVAAK